MKHRLLISLSLGVVALVGTAVVASAHGENAQEGFLRMETVAFSNVQFSKDTIKQGEDVTITGKATLLDTWPKTLGEPSTGFVHLTRARAGQFDERAPGQWHARARRDLRQEGQHLRLQGDVDGSRARPLAR